MQITRIKPEKEKRRYYATDAGKAQKTKRRCRIRGSGGRAKQEAKFPSSGDFPLMKFPLSVLIWSAMFVRVKRVSNNGNEYSYLQVVETRRDKGRVLQYVIANFGRVEEFVQSGNLDRVIVGLVAHSKTLRLIQCYRGGDLKAEWDKIWGPVMIFEKLWEELWRWDGLCTSQQAICRSAAQRLR
jgi:hypothetical protein